MYYSNIRNGDVIYMSFWSRIGLAGKKEVSILQESIKALIAENKLLREDNTKLFGYIEEARKNCLEEMFIKMDFIQQNVSESIKKENSEIEKLSTFIENIKRGIDESQKYQTQELIEKITSCQQTVDTLSRQMKDQIKLGCEDIKANSETQKQIFLERLQGIDDVNSEHSEKICSEINKNVKELEAILQNISVQQISVSQSIGAANEVLKEDKIKIARISDVAASIECKSNSVPEIENKVVALAESLQNLWTLMKAIWVDSILSDIDSL